MSISSTIKSFVESIVKSARIISPRFTDYRVDSFDFYSESGNFEGILRDDIVQVIKDEVKIQMTERKDPIAEKPVPTGSIESKVLSNVKQGMKFAQSPNPVDIVSLGLRFLPHAALIAFAISLAPLIINEITKDGGLMDTRWKRVMEQENNSFLDRQAQRNTQLGWRQLIIKTRSGFTALNPALNYNNVRQISKGGVDGNRLAQIDLFDHTKGLWN